MLGDSDAINRYGIGGLDVGHRVVYDVAANWKLIVENFMECYHCSSIHPELVGVLPEFARGIAAQANIGLGAEFGSEISGFTVDGARGLRASARGSPMTRIAATSRSPSGRRCSSTWCPTTSSSTGCSRCRRPDHRRMRLALHRRCGRPRDATCRTRSSCSTGSTNRTSRRASELSPAMSSRAYRNGGVLVPAEHHIARVPRVGSVPSRRYEVTR